MPSSRRCRPARRPRGGSVDAELAAGDVGRRFRFRLHLSSVLPIFPRGSIDVTGMDMSELVRDGARFLVGAEPWVDHDDLRGRVGVTKGSSPQLGVGVGEFLFTVGVSGGRHSVSQTGQDTRRYLAIAGPDRRPWQLGSLRLGDVEDRNRGEASDNRPAVLAAVSVFLFDAACSWGEDPDGAFAFDHLPAVLLVPLPEGHHVDVVQQFGSLLRSFLELQEGEQAVVGRPTAKSIGGHGVEPLLDPSGLGDLLHRRMEVLKDRRCSLVPFDFGVPTGAKIHRLRSHGRIHLLGKNCC